MTAIEFDTFDYRADQTFTKARYRFEGDPARGWLVLRDGAEVLRLGPGFRVLRVRQCGICSTDLARHHLPFPLPQVIGHEVVAYDDDGRRYVVEINASHAARAVAHDCELCRNGLASHCPERLTLGIHGLPGGFGPWILAPVDACIEVPSSIPDDVAVLVEPLAAAMHAVTMVAPRAGENIAVLGPRRLGMLVLASLVAERHRRGTNPFTITAVVRNPSLAALATEIGADDVRVVGVAPVPEPLQFDVVIDTTGNPHGLDQAVAMARREVHLKSTHGQPAAMLRYTTELVVDELAIEPMPSLASLAGAARRRIAWLAAAEPPAALVRQHDVQRAPAAELAERFGAPSSPSAYADSAVVDSPAAVDVAIRPLTGVERPLVRPRGVIWLHPDADVGQSAALAAIAERGLRLSASRCGDFGAALDLLASDAELRRIGERVVTHRFGASQLLDAFATAKSRACIKAVIAHDG